MSVQFIDSVDSVEGFLDRNPTILQDNPQLQGIAIILLSKINEALSRSTSCSPVSMPCTAQCDKVCAALLKSEDRMFNVDGIKFGVTRVGAVMHMSIIGKQVEGASIDMLVSGIFRDLRTFTQMDHGA